MDDHVAEQTAANTAIARRPEYRPWPFGQIDVPAGALTARGSKQAAGRFVSTRLHLPLSKRHNFVRDPARCAQVSAGRKKEDPRGM